MTKEVFRLNMGSGYVTPDDWYNVDVRDYGHGTIVADVLEGLPFSDHYFDYIVCNHTLTAVRFDDLPRALVELRRVLKVGGVLRISVPDMKLVFDMYSEGRTPANFHVSPELERTVDGQLLRYMFWHGDARSAFTQTSLKDTLNRNGFQNVRRCEFKETESDYPEIVDLDSRETESLIVECAK